MSFDEEEAIIRAVIAATAAATTEAAEESTTSSRVNVLPSRDHDETTVHERQDATAIVTVPMGTGEPGETFADETTTSSSSSGNITSTSTTTTTTVAVTYQLPQQPGAYSIPGRPVGELPAWYRNNNNNNNNNTRRNYSNNNNNPRTTTTNQQHRQNRRSSQSHNTMPPEIMRIPTTTTTTRRRGNNSAIITNTNTSSRFATNVRQSIRNIITFSGYGDVSNNRSLNPSTPTNTNTNTTTSTSARRRQSSILRRHHYRFSLSKFAGDAEVTTLTEELSKIEEEEQQDSKLYWKEIWGVLIGVLIFASFASCAVVYTMYYK